MSIKFCIFDIGQVCYPYSLEPLNKQCQKMSKDKISFDKKHGVKSFDYKPFMKGEVNFTQFCKDLCDHCDINYTKNMQTIIDDQMHQGVGKFYEVTWDVMKELKNKGIGVCLLSNALPNLEDTAKNLTTKDKIFVSYELGLLKPDIKIYQHVLKKLNANPCEIIFIDDKVINVNGAQSVGIHGIVFNQASLRQDINRLLISS